MFIIFKAIIIINNFTQTRKRKKGLEGALMKSHVQVSSKVPKAKPSNVLKGPIHESYKSLTEKEKKIIQKLKKNPSVC